MEAQFTFTKARLFFCELLKIDFARTSLPTPLSPCIKTVTFVEEDGTTVIETLTVTEGSAIAKDAVTAPDKAETAEYKYTFAGWLELITDKDGKVTEGSTYKLPLAPERDMTLKATYKETKQAYTHQFVVPTTWTDTLAAEGNTKVYTTLVGTYGQERVPSGIPVFEHENPEKDAELKKLYTFEFKGWKNAMDELVTDFTVVGDATFTAYFEAVSKTYDVIYYDGDNAGICMRPVNAGASAGTVLYEIDENGDFVLDEEGNKIVITPEKESDETKHYTFTGTWYTDATRENEYDPANGAITGTTRLYAGFTATTHTFDIVYKDENGKALTWDATCTEAGQKTEKCACGYVKTTAIKALGHSFTVTLEADRTLEDGTVLKAGTKLCARFDECGAYELPEVQKYTVTLKDSATYEGEEVSASTLGTETVVEGAAFEFTAPKKASTAEYTFRFVSWTDAEGNVVSDTEKLTVATVDANAEYTANYVATKRQYTVSYLNAESQVYMQLTVEYGAALPAAPDTAPEKASIDAYHYVFKEWIVTGGVENGVVVANVLVKPEYTPVAHEYVATGEVIGATCTQPGGVVKKCSCGKTTTTGDGADALGHSFTKEIDRKEATDKEDGYIVYECANGCKETKTVVIPKLATKDIKVTVHDADGNPVEGATVKLYKDGTYVTAKTTDVNGVVIFEIEEDGKYTVTISGVSGINENQQIQIGTGENKDVSAEKPTCSCSCHRAGFWGAVFRFFHNIIKFFTGRISCCSCPDSRY